MVEKHHPERVISHTNERSSSFFHFLVAPAVLGCMALTTRVYLPQDAELKNLRLFSRNARPAEFSPETNSIRIPSGGKASVIVNEVRIFIEDFRVRKKKARAEAQVTIGPQKIILSDERQIFPIKKSQVEVIHSSDLIPPKSSRSFSEKQPAPQKPEVA